MSNLRTPSQNRLQGGSDYDDLDCYYQTLTGAQKMESSKVAEKKPSAPAETRSRLPAARPKSLALAEQAGNLVHQAWEAGYARGFHDGQRTGLDFAESLVPAEFKLTHDPGSNPF